MTKKDIIKKDKTNTIVDIKFLKIVGLILITFISIAILALCINPVEADIEIKCNTGFIGVDYEGENFIQQFECEYEKDKLCFKEDMLTKKFIIKNINNANCDVKMKVKGSPLLILFGGG